MGILVFDVSMGCFWRLWLWLILPTVWLCLAVGEDGLVGVLCNLLDMASKDLGGVALWGLSTLFSNISGVFIVTGLPLRVMLLRRGGVA